MEITEIKPLVLPGKNIPRESLNSIQLAAASAVIDDKKSVLITGPGGTGKSYLLNYIRQEIPWIHVTGSTGIAALNVGGVTIHSWSGIKIFRKGKTAEQVLSGMHHAQKSILANAQVLAIDEISMISADFLDLLDDVLRNVRSEEIFMDDIAEVTPFGGLQVVFFGDFLQLPPVEKNKEPEFAFESEVWEQLSPEIFEMKECYRQEDQQFVDVLNMIRYGHQRQEVLDLLGSRFNITDSTPEEPPIKLFPTNKDCDFINSAELQKLLSDGAVEKTYTANDRWTSEGEKMSPKYQPFFKKTVEKDCLAKENIQLAVGARVMLLRNLDVSEGLVNGSMGTVEDFRAVLPLDSMGETDFTAEPKTLPIVKFDNYPRPIPIQPVEWEFYKENKCVLIRKQVPLRLAWAITIHKSQGMSLSKMEANLDECFADGQVYVALSRARSVEGLFLVGRKTVINLQASEKAIEFYRSLENAV